ncbi:hypothetical protein AcW2_005269 [Taiwanofungus camphoratus]|nr:hypothetical protein AcW2_005269 [Antrodia cinnamomea]
MGRASDIFCEQLYSLGHGAAQWFPEVSKDREVLLGDVGCILGESFSPMFNATFPADHKINQKWGTPPQFQPLRIADSQVQRREAAIPPGPLCSQSVEYEDLGDHAHGTRGDFRFRCKQGALEGAVMVLNGETAQAELHPDPALTSYIMRNHKSWLDHATETLGVDVREEDVVMVRGWTKAREWNSAAFFEGQAARLAFGGGPGSLAQAAFALDVPPGGCMSGQWAQRAAPPAAPRAHLDQCVFIQYYKLKSRPPAVSGVIKSGARPRGITPPSDEDSEASASSPLDQVYVKQIEEAEEYEIIDDFDELEELYGPQKKWRDPVEFVLDYILEYSQASVAIASDADVTAVCKGHGFPCDMARLLEDVLPPTEVNEEGLGMLSYGNLDPNERTPN